MISPVRFFNARLARRIALSLIIASAVLQPLPAYAWGQTGHRIIAKIAYDNLNCGTRRKIDKLLGKHGMIYWANWPDEIKSDTIYPQSIKDGWHYQDFNPGMTDAEVAETLTRYPAEGGNLLRATDSLIAEVKGTKKNLNPHTLRFLVHLVGDRYCPMHTAHIDDKGGNAVRMAWFSKQNNTNLHAVWDSKLIDSQGYSYTEYAQMIEDKYTYLRRDILDMTPEELLIRNYHVTEAIYAYQDVWDGNTYHYIYRWHEPMELQLYFAGIRLAKLLNDIL